MAVRIVTDSTSSLPAEFVTGHNVPVVPLKVSVNGVYYREYVELSPDAFYEKQTAGAKSGTTQPGPEEFTAVYDRLLQGTDDEILSVHLSAAMSGTLNSAYIAAEQTRPGRVHLYDTRTAGLALGFMVMEAVRLAEGGAKLGDIVSALGDMQRKTHLYFLVGTMKYLVAGGRVGKAAGVAASLLQIKPILTVRDGIVDVYERPRTMRKAMDRIWAIMDQAIVQGIQSVGFHYAGNRTQVEAIQQEFAAKTGIASVLTQLGPVLGCHAGPETTGIVIVDR